MRAHPTAVVLLAALVAGIALFILALSGGSASASEPVIGPASLSADPELTFQVEQIATEIVRTEAVVKSLRADLARLDKQAALLQHGSDSLALALAPVRRSVLALRCVVRLSEDGSASFRDAETLGKSCRRFVAQYVGSGQARSDARRLR